MQCVDATERLLADDVYPEQDADLLRHLDDCGVCAHVARGLHRVDHVLASTLVVAPPLDLQRQLAQLALEAARAETIPWWRRLGDLNLTDWFGRPQMVAAQGLAAVMLALASWQIFGVLSAFQPVVGDVGYAVAQVAGSPAAGYLNGLPVDLQSLGLWSLVGIGGWLVSENGLIGRRLNSGRQQQP